MDNILLETENPISKPVRSQLLKVLCILSFVMCGVNLVSGIMNIYQTSPEVMAKNIEQIRTIKPEMADQMENQMIAMQDNAYAKIAPYLNFIYILISFLSVMMMWNLKKTGFYIYSFAEILPYTGFIFMGKNSMNMMAGGGENMAMIGMIAMVLMVIIDLVFVALYSKCLKEMK